MSSRSHLELPWDWSDPAIRRYPHLKLKLLLGFVLGLVAVMAIGYFLSDGTTGLLARVSPVAVAYLLSYPFIVAVGLGNIKRMARESPSAGSAKEADSV